MEVKQELLLKGDHLYLQNTALDHSQPFLAHSFKDLDEFSNTARFVTFRQSKAGYNTAVQLVRPFLYSSSSWWRSGCRKNMSFIVPNQVMICFMYIQIFECVHSRYIKGMKCVIFYNVVNSQV